MATFGRQNSIHSLPNETMIEILEWSCGADIPSRRLALVCKEWRSILQNTPTFWRKTIASYVSHKEADSLAEQMVRRLELSRQVLLDVTLDGEYYFFEESEILFDITCQVNLNRWRSLIILDSTGPLNPSIMGQLHGAFSSLVSLDLRDRGVNKHLQNLLASSPSTLCELWLDDPLPACLQTTTFLSNVRRARLPADQYGTIAGLASIETLELEALYGCDLSALPSLLATVKLMKVQGRDLFMLNLTAVRSLEIQDMYQEAVGGGSPHLPSLASLAIPGGFRFCYNFVAPNMTSLRLCRHSSNPYAFTVKEWGKESARVLLLFKKDAEPLLFTPISLRIDVPFTSTAVITILSQWIQLQHLHLNLLSNKRFTWKGPFSRALIQTKPPPCPNLVTFKLQTAWSMDDSSKWEKTVRRMFGQPERSALSVVSWTHGSASDVLSAVRREDVFPSVSYTLA